MRKNKLLLLLALLLTAATGAWATDVYVVGNGTGNWLNGAIWDPGAAGNKMTEQNGVYSITFTNVDANSELQFKFAINGSWDVNYGCSSETENELNKTLSNIDATGGYNFTFGLTEAADVTISFNLSEMTYMISTKGMKVGDDASSAPKHLITAKYRERTRLLEQPLPYATTIGELFEAVTGEHFSDLISTMSSMEMPLTGISSNNTSAVSIGELNGASTPVTVIADGEATVAINFSGYPLGILVSAISPLYVSLKDGVKDADKWTVKVGEGQAQALPIGGLKGDGSETVTLQYNGRLKVKGVKATSEAAAPAAPTYNETKSINDGSVTVAAGEHWLITGTGTQTSNTMTIGAGATVTLDGVNISTSDYCIKCAGDATIILKDGSTNTLTSTSDEYPALSIGDANTTLTIQGSTGVLNVTSGDNCAGIGGGYMNADNTCGNIRIEGGVITSQGGQSGSGIGSDCGKATCGDIIITGGTITAKGGTNAAGIGTGSGFSNPVVCGDITIANTVTKVTATKGTNASHSIGKGYGGKATCGTVTIGGTKYWENNAAVNGGDTYLAQNPLIYDPAAPAEEPVTLATPLTIEAITDGTIQVNMNGTLSTGMKYSVNGGTKTLITTTTSIEGLKAGDKVQFYGNGTQTQAYGDSPEVKILGSGDGFKTNVYGNIMSLLDEEGFATKTDLPDAQWVFYGLFNGNTTLNDASELQLPATQLAKSCYQGMFVGCTNLIKAPALPATQLAANCYGSMFNGCSALTAAPVLPATQLVTNCYHSMFNNCKKLATVTCLATSGINQDNSTTYWLQNAGSQAEGTKTFNAVSTANWPSGFNGILEGWDRVNIDN